MDKRKPTYHPPSPARDGLENYITNTWVPKHPFSETYPKLVLMFENGASNEYIRTMMHAKTASPVANWRKVYAAEQASKT